MRRRAFLALAGSAAVSPRATLAQPVRMLRVGTANVQPRSAPQWVAFERRMAELGYVEGRNFIYDHVQIPNVKSWESVYREVIARKPDIILAAGPEQSLKAARAAAGMLPVVMIAVDYDPVARGHVASLARPEGNVTGVYFQTAELAPKTLQLLKELLPDAVSGTIFFDQASSDFRAAAQRAASRFGLRLTAVEFRQRPYDYVRAIAGVAPGDRQFLMAQGSPFFFLDREALAEMAVQNRVASIVGLREPVVAGGLMSYGVSLAGMFALAATYVDRIAKGAAPADLPVQQPTKFELVLNLKTAAALGLIIPPALLAQADEVIE